ncbi:MAG: heme o synthase [Bryobacteraceae bacterium]|jgi:protoheme IX farnesyltransferase
MNSVSTPALEIGRVAQPSRFLAVRDLVRDFWTLTKPEVNFLIVIATFTGFYLAAVSQANSFRYDRLFHALVGTLLVASGAGVLNQFLEHRFDARMRRTSRRPIAAGRLRPSTGLWFGTLLSALGATYLLLVVNYLASLLAVATLGTYLFVYTPLKRRTPLSTVAGAFPGAVPPLIGWVAAGGSITSAEAWILYSLLFLWQFPHFMAIAWMYREDYARAGYYLLPQEHDHTFVAWLTAVPSLALFVVSVLAVDGTTEGILQYSCTVVLGLGLLYYAARLILFRSRIAARHLLKASIIYLPLEFLILTVGKR